MVKSKSTKNSANKTVDAKTKKRQTVYSTRQGPKVSKGRK